MYLQFEFFLEGNTYLLLATDYVILYYQSPECMAFWKSIKFGDKSKYIYV